MGAIPFKTEEKNLVTSEGNERGIYRKKSFNERRKESKIQK